MRASRAMLPARPVSWAVIATAATAGPKAPRNPAGMGSETGPRASSTASHQKAQANPKATTKYLSREPLAWWDDPAVALTSQLYFVRHASPVGLTLSPRSRVAAGLVVQGERCR